MGQVRKPMAGDIYRHFKDRLYEIITLAIHSETEEEMVVYRQMYGTFETYVRPLPMFLSEVDHEKYPDVKQKYRFERVGALKQEDGEHIQKESEKALEPEAVKVGESPMEAVKAAQTAGQKASSEKAVETQNLGDLYQAENGTEELDETTKLLMRFLDARTYGEKLAVLEEVTGELDDRTINNMAISMDLVIEEGTSEERFRELRDCIRTKAKYECFRLH